MSDNAISYDESIGDLLDEIETKLDQIRQLRGPEREHTLRTTQDLVKECKKKHHSLKVEIRSLPKDEKSIYDRKAKAHYEKIQELSNAILKLKSEDTADGSPGAFGGGHSSPSGGGDRDDGRDEVRNAFGRINKHQDASMAAVRNMETMIGVTEQTAQDTNQELLKQREKIEEIDRKLDEMGTDIARARKELNAFVRRMATDKLILCFLFLLVLGIVLAIIFHFVLGKDDPNNAVPAAPEH